MLPRLLVIVALAACGARAGSAPRVAATPSEPAVAPSAPAPPGTCSALPALDARIELRPQTQHHGAIKSLAFSPDGRFLASASDDATLRIWDVEHHDLLHVVTWPLVSRFAYLAWACDGQLIATATRARKGDERYEVVTLAIDPRTGAVRDVSTPEMAWIVWPGTAPEACWTQSTATGFVRRDGGGAVTSRTNVADLLFTWGVDATADGRSAVLPHMGKAIRIIRDGRIALSIPREFISTLRAAISRDAKYVALSDHGLEIVDAATGKVVDVPPKPHPVYDRSFGEVAFGTNLLYAADWQGIHAYSLPAKAWLWHVPVPSDLGRTTSALALGANDSILAVGRSTGELALFRASDGARIADLGSPLALPHRALVSADGAHLYVLAGDRIARWSLRTGELERTLVAPQLREIAIDDTGALVVAQIAPGYGCEGVDTDRRVIIHRSAELPEAFDLAADAGASQKTLELVSVDEPRPPDAPRPAVELCMHEVTSLLAAPAWSDAAVARGSAFAQIENGIALRTPSKLIPLQRTAVGEQDLTMAERAPRVIARAGLGVEGAVTLWNSEDGTQIGAFAFLDGKPVQNGKDWLRQTVSHGAISADGALVAVSSRTKVGVLTVGAQDPGRAVDVAHEVSALAFDGARLLVGGGDGTLSVVDGTAVRSSASAGRQIVQVRAAGARIITIDEDGFVTLWDAASLAPLVAFAQFDDGEGFAVTPQGFYTGSYDALDRVAWVFADRGVATPAAQYDRVARDPAWIAERLACRAPARLATIQVPPSVAFAELPAATTRADHATLALIVHDAESVVAYVEGRERARVAASGARVQLDVPLAPGPSSIEVIAFDRSGIASAPIRTRVARAQPGAPAGTLWVVAVGVSEYPNLPARMQLRYADDDARSLAAALRRSAEPQYARTDIVTLTDRDVSRKTVDDALARLAAMGPDDVAVVLFSGHGVRLPDSGKMVFATPAVEATRESFARLGIGWDAVARRLADAKGKVIVLLDACHAGAMVGDLLAANSQLAADLVASGRAGTVVFSASRAAQVSREAAGNGRFTAAVLAATGDRRTDTNGNGMLDLSEIITAVRRRVLDASTQGQEPNVIWREVLGDFAVLPAPR